MTAKEAGCGSCLQVYKLQVTSWALADQVRFDLHKEKL